MGVVADIFEIRERGNSVWQFLLGPVLGPIKGHLQVLDE